MSAAWTGSSADPQTQTASSTFVILLYGSAVASQDQDAAGAAQQGFRPTVAGAQAQDAAGLLAGLFAAGGSSTQPQTATAHPSRMFQRAGRAVQIQAVRRRNMPPPHGSITPTDPAKLGGF